MGITDSGSISDSDDFKTMEAKVEKGREYYEILAKTAEQVGDLAAAREFESRVIKNNMADKLIELGLAEDRTKAEQEINDLLAGRNEALTENKDALQALYDLRLEDLKVMDKTEKGVEKYGKQAKNVFGSIAESLGVTNVMNNKFIKEFWI